MITAPDTASHYRSYWPILAIATTFVICAVVLHFEGRLWICACNTVRLWSGQICSSDNSQHILDPYSFTHLLHGFLFFWLIALAFSRLRGGWQLALVALLEASWEVFENTNFVINRYRTETAALGYSGDTVVNSFGDILCCLIGFLIARRLGWRRSLVVFFLLEFILIFWIRDSLLLQILMLIVPIDAIRAVQLCH
ncbi:MAG TPA: DUF2585 family protein [Pyrinomonadaceae bacterium]|nr:DUF2585 family protein [Pyrinomonadaceae bacterium]